MKRHTPPPIPEETISALRDFVASGKNQGEIIAKMREFGLYQGRSVGLLEELTGVTHPEAKMAVHYSDTWADCREATEALHETMYLAAKELGFEEVEAEQQEHEAMQTIR